MKTKTVFVYVKPKSKKLEQINTERKLTNTLKSPPSKNARPTTTFAFTEQSH